MKMSVFYAFRVYNQAKLGFLEQKPHRRAAGVRSGVLDSPMLHPKGLEARGLEWTVLGAGHKHTPEGYKNGRPADDKSWMSTCKKCSPMLLIPS